MVIEIIIPAYNCSKTLNKTLSSLECQTDSNFLVHVIDDNSTEDLSSIISSHQTLNIRTTKNKTNLGCGMTRQVGIDNTTADYIAFLDSDDVLMPYSVEVWRKMAENNKDIDVFHSYFYEQKNDEILLHQNGFTWCHGKLYKVNFIKKWDIRNNPEVKLADDSYFNSICFELGKMNVIQLPMYFWIDNKNSITRSGKETFQYKIYDFVHAMKLSVMFVKDKGIEKINHITNTINNIELCVSMFDEKTKAEYEQLKQFLQYNTK